MKLKTLLMKLVVFVSVLIIPGISYANPIIPGGSSSGSNSSSETFNTSWFHFSWFSILIIAVILIIIFFIVKRLRKK